MTREDANSCIGTIEMLQRLAYNIHGVMDVIDADNCKKIIKALEQEPCEDCISREAAIKVFGEVHPMDYNTQAYITNIQNLPSVTPRLKTGYWIEEEDFFGDIGYKCSICNEVFSTIEYEPNDSTMNHCPNCGAKNEVEYGE